MKANSRRLAILAEGTLDFHHGKTAVSILRYKPEEVAAVIDSDHGGSTTRAVVGVGGNIPIVNNVEEARALGATTLLIGIASRGGDFPIEWRSQILFAIRNGMDVVSGLHHMLNDDPEFVQTAREWGVPLRDVRKPPDGLSVASLADRRPGSKVITFVGSDCAVGKMTAALEITSEARKRGLSSAFVATGQTGIMLEGKGIAIDRVIGDFMAGATEQMVVEAADSAEWIFVEGQGSLVHPAYSGVTLALIHGSAPDAMILVDQVDHYQVDEYPVQIPNTQALVEMYETAAGWVRPAKVIAIALNTRSVDELRARNVIQETELLTQLPTTDPVRFGAGSLVEALLDAFAIHQESAQRQVTNAS